MAPLAGPFPDTPREATSGASSAETKTAGLLDWLGLGTKPAEEPKTQNIQGDRGPGTNRSDYPTHEDAAFARKYDYAYGQTWEPFFNNLTARVIGTEDKGKFTPESGTKYARKRVEDVFNAPTKNVDLTLTKNAAIKEELKDVFARAALATNRSALATLGFTPSRTMMDVVSKHLNVGGAYHPALDDPESEGYKKQSSAIFSSMSATRDEGNIYGDLAVHDSIVHESIHRGIQLLRQRRPEETQAALDLMGVKKTMTEEDIPRYIMQQKMGDVESQDQGENNLRDIQDAKFNFATSTLRTDRLKGLEQLEVLAAEEYAKKRPGGPR